LSQRERPLAIERAARRRHDLVGRVIVRVLTAERSIKLVLEYDGTAYAGWQRQMNAPSVQQALEERLREMTQDAALRVTGAGRTDAGVHALGQVASFRTRARIPTHGFLRGLNSLLPPDIAVVACEEVPGEFDARRSARG